MTTWGEAKLKAVFILGAVFFCVAIARALEASRAADAGSMKPLTYFFLVMGIVCWVGAWIMAHRQADDQDNSRVYDGVRRWRTLSKLRNGQCRRCGAILPDDATSRLCTDHATKLSA